MGDNAGVAKVVNPPQSLLSHSEAGWEHLGKHRHGVGDVNNAFVLDDLRNEIAMAEIVADGHAHAQNKAVGVAFEHGFHVALSLRVEALVEVGDVVLREANAGSEWVGVVVFEYASRCVNGAVNSALVAQIGEVERADDVGADRLGHVILAPVDVWTAGDAGGHEDVGGLDVVELRGDVGAVLAACVGEDEFDALFLEQVRHLAAYPSGLASIDENFGEGCRRGHVVGVYVVLDWPVLWHEREIAMIFLILGE